MTVLVISVAMLSLLAVLFTRTTAQRGTHSMLADQTRALVAAKGLLQPAIYKCRVLPAEFFRLNDTTIDAASRSTFLATWMTDFDPTASSSAKLIAQQMPAISAMGISTFTRVLMQKPGLQYRRDYIHLESWAVCNGQRKVVQELLEMSVTQ
ncbi:MAG TPA: hypothetical protein PKO06_14210 [Candidatus Ozemobacteraceae bacterium]|nr:hypothetical protein [Candidatus Ozemobacteraceae bacterium]